MPEEKQIAIYPPKEIGDFWIKAEYTDCWCEFTCVEAIADDGAGTTLSYGKNWNRGTGEQSLVEDPTQADVYLSGHIKWDGCANLRFEEQEEDCGIHLCGRRDAMRSTGELINTLYDIAADLMMPNWQGDD